MAILGPYQQMTLKNHAIDAPSDLYFLLQGARNYPIFNFSDGKGIFNLL